MSSPHPKDFGGLLSHLTFIARLCPSPSSLPRRGVTVCRPPPAPQRTDTVRALPFFLCVLRILLSRAGIPHVSPSH